MKKTVIYILIAAMLLACTVIPVGAVPQVVLDMTMPTAVGINQTFDVVISVDPSQANGGILTLNFNLKYDTSLLTFVSASCANPDSWLFLSNCKNGQVYLYSEAPFGGDGYYDPISENGGLVYTVTFRSASVNGTASVATAGSVTGTQSVNTALIYGNSLTGRVTVADTHNIYFDAGLGTGAPEPMIKRFGTDLMIPMTVPVRGGYDFAGWTVYPSDSVSYRPGDMITQDADMLLVARWIPHPIESTGEDAYVDGDYLILSHPMTVDEAKVQLTDPDCLSFYNAQYYPIGGSDAIGTGYNVMLTGQGTQTVLDELVIVVMGDLNGNTQCESNDCALIRNRYLTGPALTDTPADIACDFNGNRRADSNDYIRVRMNILGMDAPQA